jgi:23S rRNA pseudouridine1911/1915/1917 synthase
MIEPAPGAVLSLCVPDDAAGVRLDRFLASVLPGTSRAALRRWILDGHVLVQGVPAPKTGVALRAGTELTVRVPAAPDAPATGTAVAFDVLHEDDALIVVDKPAGVVVHSGHGREHGTLVDGLLARGTALAGRGAPLRPGIVHRLDVGTSGVIVVAKTDAAYDALARAFAERRVGKRYLALVWGRVEPPAGRIEAAVGRSRRDPTRMAVRDTRGRSRDAVTSYRTREALAGFSLLDVAPETGRTHQIRVHLESIHHPIVGDERYGGRRWRGVLDPRKRHALRDIGRLALHAARLDFVHPTTGEPVTFRAPWPADLAALVDVLRDGG